MKCPKCGAEAAGDAAFCGNCGYDFSADNIMNELDKPEEEKPKEKKKPGGKAKAGREKNTPSDEEKKKKRIKLRITLIAAAAFVVAAAVIIFVLSLSSTEGEKVLKNIPIGRDMAYAESKTDRDFTLVSKYDAFGSVADFDGVCEADSGIKIEGIHLPEWAVTVTLASDNTIKTAAYYDFSQLQKSWKGHHSAGEIPVTNIEYGMNEKAVERAMGFKPYAVVKKIDNTASRIYRYYYSDDITGNDKVCNFVVVFDDANGTVKDVYVKTVDFCGLMLSVNS